MIHDGTWSATDFFRSLSERNRLACDLNFGFASVSGLQGFLDAISLASGHPNIIAVDDTSEGYSSIANTPHRRMVKAVYMAMRHAPGDMAARAACFSIMHEIFRQFMSVLIREKTRLEQKMINIDPRIGFSEMDRYFCTGQACAFFQITVDVDTDMRYNTDEWKT